MRFHALVTISASIPKPDPECPIQEIDLPYGPLAKKLTKNSALVTKICFFHLSVAFSEINQKLAILNG